MLKLFSFREHNNSMTRLRKLLSNSSKAGRNRRNILNIHITVLAWLAEFFGFLACIFGSFILGHKNSTVTMCLQTFSMTIYIIILPCIILINSSEVKDQIVDSNWYMEFINWIGHKNVDPSSLPEDDRSSIPADGDGNVGDGDVGQQDALDKENEHDSEFIKVIDMETHEND